MRFIKFKSKKELISILQKKLKYSEETLEKSKSENNWLRAVLRVSRRETDKAEEAVEVYRQDAVELEKKLDQALQDVQEWKETAKFFQKEFIKEVEKNK